MSESMDGILTADQRNSTQDEQLSEKDADTNTKMSIGRETRVADRILLSTMFCKLVQRTVSD